MRNLKDKLFYLPGAKGIVQVKSNADDYLILGGVCSFLNDSKTGITRQCISTENFNKQKPVELDEKKLSEYKFLYEHDFGQGLSSKSWRVVQYDNTKNPASILKNAAQLPFADKPNPGY